MSNISANPTDLNEGSSEALQDQLYPIVLSDAASAAEAINRLTKQLGGLVGEDAIREFNKGRNERGELVNEEGLPIIDITEPLASASARGTGNSLLAEETPPVPIHSLPPPVRDRWKQEQERILDLLEEEERAEQIREEQGDAEEREAILRKRREAAAKEKEKMKASKEMQKKMGKALLRDMAKTSSKEDTPRPTPELIEKSDKAKGKSPKKTVSFADESGDEESLSSPSNTSKAMLDWGDVTPARLQSNSSRPLLRSSETLPMKMNVVERQPTNQPKISTQINGDSDDESDPETIVDADQDSVHSPVESESEGELVLEAEEYDVDFAQHQREIALQYYEKRSKFGEEALVAMTSHSHDVDEDARVDIPLDMPSEPHPKPSLSQFRANRIASSYSASTPSSSSVSLGASVLPASTARTIQKAVKTGKLDADGRLVGGDLDSASEDEVDGMQDVLELIKKGEVYNLGPDGKYIHTIPPRNADGKHKAPPPVSAPVDAKPLPALNRPKASKFKLDRSQAGRPALHVSPPPSAPNSRSETPISDAQRSSPKMPIFPSVTERRPPTRTTPPVGSSSERGTLKAGPPVMPSMIVESPSFAKPSHPMPSMIVESPSFARPTNPRPPVIISSPTFASPAPNPSTSRPTRPPVVLSSSVLETSKAPTANTKTTIAEPGKKISRFMADRM